MDNQCCTIKMSEIENGYKIEITGSQIKECCNFVMEKTEDCCKDLNSGDQKTN